MVMLDPFNTRSLAFQIVTLAEHLSSLPSLLEDGMMEEPANILLTLSSEVKTQSAADLNAAKMRKLELALMRLSDAVAARYFLQGANAVPTIKLAGLA